jgi:hypothetical protein
MGYFSPLPKSQNIWRSRSINIQNVKTPSAANLRERLKAGALANTNLNLEIAEEWLRVELEAWRKLEREERPSATAPAR